MAQTTFSGPVVSQNGFIGGTSTDPIAVTTASKISSFYGTTSATSGDTRLNYSKLTFTAAGGAGETLRAYSVVTGTGAAVGGTINGAHISMDIDGSGTISGAGNAIRATLGGTSTNPGGTLAAIQLDSNFASGGTWTNASFIRCTNSGTGTISTLLTAPAAMFQAATTPTVTKGIAVKDSSGNTFYLLCSSALS